MDVKICYIKECCYQYLCPCLKYNSQILWVVMPAGQNVKNKYVCQSSDRQVNNKKAVQCW